MFCTQCGKPNPDNARFCSSCGVQIVTPPAAVSSPPATVAPSAPVSSPAVVAAPPNAAPVKRADLLDDFGALLLTPEEKSLLLWEPGDWFDVLPGTLEVVGEGALKPNPNLEIPFFKFLFEVAYVERPVEDMKMFGQSSLPNGPVLLLQYCRRVDGNNYRGSPFGLVSMVNKSWTHVNPIEKDPLILHTEKFKQLYMRQAYAIFMRASPIKVPFELNFTARIQIELLCRSGIAKNDVILQMDPEVEAIYSCLRKLMARIVKNADVLYGGGSTGSGKL